MGGARFINLFGNSKGIKLSGSSFTAGAAQGTAIGVLTVDGGSGTYTFTLTDSAGGKVQVAAPNGRNLQVGATASPVPASFSITVHADNGAGSTFDKTFLISAIAAPVGNTLQSDVGVDILADVGQPILVQ
jgi:hypothetical protein